jgi:hypothetical protein
MANRTWSAVLDGVWSLAANWSGAAVPGDGDVVIFDSSAVTRCTVSAAQECDALELREGYTGECLAVDGGAITVSGGAGDSIIVQSGTLSANGGRFSFAQKVTQSGGAIKILSGGLATFSGQWHMTGGTVSVSGTIVANGTGGTNITGGAISCVGSPTIKLGSPSITFRPATFTKATSIIEFDWSSNQTITIDTIDFHEIKASVGGTKTFTGGCPTYAIITEAAPAVFSFPNCISSTLEYRLNVATARRLARGKV